MPIGLVTLVLVERDRLYDWGSSIHFCFEGAEGSGDPIPPVRRMLWCIISTRTNRAHIFCMLRDGGPCVQAKKAAKEAQKERRKTKIKKHVKQQRIKHTSGSKKK